MVAVLFLWVAFSTASDVEPPDEIVIHSKLWPKKKYMDTKFSHAKHVTEYKIECNECHHVYEGGKNVWKRGDKVQSCETCHNVAKTGKELREASADEKKRSLYTAFHDNCKECHKKEKKGPVKCLECHAKKPK